MNFKTCYKYFRHALVQTVIAVEDILFLRFFDAAMSTLSNKRTKSTGTREG